MHYKLLVELEPNLLGKVVTNFLDEGWKLHGSPVIALTDDRLQWEYAQAVTFSTGDAQCNRNT
jgi:hypothetical protein